MKITQHTSNYLKTNTCTKCDWFQRPFVAMFGSDLPDFEICPRCGSSIEHTTGRFTYEKRSFWYRESLINYTNFIIGTENEPTN